MDIGKRQLTGQRSVHVYRSVSAHVRAQKIFRVHTHTRRGSRRRPNPSQSMNSDPFVGQCPVAHKESEQEWKPISPLLEEIQDASGNRIWPFQYPRGVSVPTPCPPLSPHSFQPPFGPAVMVPALPVIVSAPPVTKVDKGQIRPAGPPGPPPPPRGPNGEYAVLLPTRTGTGRHILVRPNGTYTYLHALPPSVAPNRLLSFSVSPTLSPAVPPSV